MKKYLEIGKIVSTQGLKGEVRVSPWCEPLSFLCTFKNIYLDPNGNKVLNIKNSRVQKNVVIIKFEDVDSIEDAKLFCNKTIYINRNDAKLEEDEFFIQDIVGLNVFDYNTNQNYGKVTDVFKTGANDVYEITNDNNQKHLIPAIKDVIIETNIDDNILKIIPLKGLFDDEN